MMKSRCDITAELQRHHLHITCKDGLEQGAIALRRSPVAKSGGCTAMSADQTVYPPALRWCDLHSFVGEIPAREPVHLFGWRPLRRVTQTSGASFFNGVLRAREEDGILAGENCLPGALRARNNVRKDVFEEIKE